jgi:hypothetical protein
MSETSLLEDLFEKTEYGAHGTSFLRFRVGHELHLDKLDEMERRGLICRENDEYRITVFGIHSVRSPRSVELLDNLDRVYATLRQRYRENPGEPVLLGDIVLSLGVPVLELAGYLKLMTGCSLWSSGWSDLSTVEKLPEAYIIPAEGILKHPTFRACLNEVEGWRRPSNVSAAVEAGIEIESHLRQAIALQPSSVARFPVDGTLLSLIPQDQSGLLNEVYIALNQELYALASMGLRTLIDMVCLEKVGDVGGFRAKIRRLATIGHIAQFQEDVLLKVIDAGSASAHRGFMPGLADIEVVFSVVTPLLRSLYVHPEQVNELAKNTPQRS